MFSRNDLKCVLYCVTIIIVIVAVVSPFLMPRDISKCPPSLGDWGGYVGGMGTLLALVWAVGGYLFNQMQIEENQKDIRNQLEIFRGAVGLVLATQKRGRRELSPLRTPRPRRVDSSLSLRAVSRDQAPVPNGLSRAMDSRIRWRSPTESRSFTLLSQALSRGCGSALQSRGAPPSQPGRLDHFQCSARTTSSARKGFVPRIATRWRGNRRPESGTPCIAPARRGRSSCHGDDSAGHVP
jgi:hypothetical protein